MGTRPWMAAVLLTASAPLLAHHALSVDYDLKVPVTLRGPIVRVEWVNPHTYIYVRVTMPGGDITTWQVEGGAPRTLSQQKLTREMLALGTIVVITGYNSKDGSPKALGEAITFPDATKYQIISRSETKPKPKPASKQPTPPLSDMLWSYLPVIGVAVPCLVMVAGLGILWWRRFNGP